MPNIRLVKTDDYMFVEVEGVRVDEGHTISETTLRLVSEKLGANFEDVELDREAFDALY